MKTKAILTCLLLAILALSPLEADDSTGWRLRLNGVSVEPDGELHDSDGNLERSDIEAAVGLSLSAEYRFSPRVGIEFGVLGSSGVDVELRSSSYGNVFLATDSITFTSGFAGVNYHLTPGRKFDLYAGPLLAHVSYTDISFGGVDVGPVLVPVTIGVHNDSAVGATLGLDVPLGEGSWLFSGNLRYLDTSLDGSVFGAGRGAIDFDPIIVGLGFGYSF